MSKASAPTYYDIASSSVTKPRRKQLQARLLLSGSSRDCRCRDWTRFETSQSFVVMQRAPSTPLGSSQDDEHARTPAEILKKIRLLEIKTRRLVETAFAGDYHHVFKSRGMNFEDVRGYQPGHEIRANDLNRTGPLGN